MAICKIEKFSDEEIIEIISSSKTAKEALERFGYKKTNNAPLIRKYAEKYNIDISHYPKKGELEDLTNQIYGQLTVLFLNKDLTKERGKTFWTCRCSCGNIHDVWAADLKRGAVKSCGCLKTKGRIKDLTNQVFDDLKVLSLNEEKSGKGNSAYWNVICLKCNTIGVIRGDTIQERRSFNCNCLRHSKNEVIISNYLKEHNIDFIPQYSFEDLKGENGKLFFDFKINDFLLEYQGEQHYRSVEYFGGIDKFKQQQKYDQKKRDYCKKYGIRLYEITYKDNTIEKLEEILNKELSI